MNLASVASLHRDRASVYKWVSIRMLPRQVEECKGIHLQLHHSEEASQRIPPLIEKVSTQIGTSPKVPFRFTQSSRSPSVHSLSPEGRQACPRNPDDQTHYCIHISVTLGGGGDHPPPSHTWSGSLIADIFQDDLKEQITEAVILAPGEAILFFGRQLCKEGLPFGSARDIRFSLTGSVNWAGRLAQVEATVNTVQEGH